MARTTTTTSHQDLVEQAAQALADWSQHRTLHDRYCGRCWSLLDRYQTLREAAGILPGPEGTALLEGAAR